LIFWLTRFIYLVGLKENNRKKQEKEAALNRYKRTKKETYQKLSRKTKHGQIFMGDRIKNLLQKIEEKIPDS
jgi:hypothetical protein